MCSPAVLDTRGDEGSEMRVCLQVWFSGLGVVLLWGIYCIVVFITQSSQAREVIAKWSSAQKAAKSGGLEIVCTFSIVFFF